MLITRGLGSGLLITQGYGGVGVLKYPYCPTDTAFLTAPVLVQVLTSPFSKAASMVLTAQPSYEEIPSPYSVAAGVLTEGVDPIESTAPNNVESAEVISNTPTPHSELPKHCA